VHGLGCKYDLALLLIFAMIVALGIKLMGTLLVGALTVIPAAVAKNVSRSMRGYIVLSALLGGTLSIGGMWMAEALRFLPGPSIILFGVGLFLLSLASTVPKKRQDGLVAKWRVSEPNRQEEKPRKCQEVHAKF